MWDHIIIEKSSILAEKLCTDEAREVMRWGQQMGDKVDPRLGVA